jgi:hypothetical protein
MKEGRKSLVSNNKNKDKLEMPELWGDLEVQMQPEIWPAKLLTSSTISSKIISTL